MKEEKGTYEGYGDDSLTAKQLTKQEPNYTNGGDGDAGGGGGDGGEAEVPPDTKEGILESINEYGSAADGDRDRDQSD